MHQIHSEVVPLSEFSEKAEPEGETRECEICHNDFTSSEPGDICPSCFTTLVTWCS